MSDETTTVDLSEFNVQATVNFFDYLPRTEMEIKAIRYLHQCLGLGIDTNGETLTTHANIVNNIAIDKIKYRYQTYKLHADCFFPKGHEVAHDALAIAVICDEYTADICDPPPEPEAPEGWQNDNDNHKSKISALADENTLEEACALWEQAAEMEGEGIPDDMPPIQPEIFFLAHINAMESMLEIQSRLDSYDNDGLADILESDIRAIRTFVMPQTALGAELLEITNIVEDEILPRMIIEPHELPNHGLKVISTEPPAPLPQ